MKVICRVLSHFAALGILFLEWINGVYSFISLILRRRNVKQVLIVEFNSENHIETIPGYVHYFNELGYNATVLLRYKNFKADTFCLMNQPPKRYCMPLTLSFIFVQKFAPLFYNYILINSDILFLRHPKRKLLVSKMILQGKLPRARIGFVEHAMTVTTELLAVEQKAIRDGIMGIIQEWSFVLTALDYDGILYPQFWESIHKREYVMQLPDLDVHHSPIRVPG